MYVLVTKTNYCEFKAYLEEMESFYFGREPSFLEQTVSDGSVVCLVYRHPELDLIGGAKISVPNEDHPVRKSFQDYGYVIEDCKVIEDVFFHIPDENPIHDDEDRFYGACYGFYRGLYEAIRLYAEKDKKEALLTYNAFDEHEDIKHFGNWPFVAEYQLDYADPQDTAVIALIPVMGGAGGANNSLC
jgi:hypothetical protein